VFTPPKLGQDYLTPVTFVQRKSQLKKKIHDVEKCLLRICGTWMLRRYTYWRPSHPTANQPLLFKGLAYRQFDNNGTLRR